MWSYLLPCMYGPLRNRTAVWGSSMVFTAAGLQWFRWFISLARYTFVRYSILNSHDIYLLKKHLYEIHEHIHE